MADADRDPAADPDALFARFRSRGDAGALASLFDATAPDLYRLALTLAPDPATAEDAVQEAFLAAIEHAGRFDPSRPVLPWLVGVLRHKVEDLRRRGARRPDPWRLPIPVEDEAPPLTEAARREREERVRAALEGLPDALRVPALLRWRHGLDPADIAHLLRQRPGTVRMALSRAIERLRPRLGALAGVALSGGPRAPRGLGAVRSEVVARAAVPAAAGAAAATVGGLLMAKKAIAGAAALLLLLGWGAWKWIGEADPFGGGAEPRPAGRPATTTAVTAAPVPSAGLAADPASSAAGAGAAAASPTTEAPAPEAPAAEATPGHPGLIGAVFDGERRPAAGARVRLLLPDGQERECRAAEDGSFRLVPPRVRVRGRARVAIVATDARGLVGWATTDVGFADAEPPEGWVMPGLAGIEIVLRQSCSVQVRVVSGGAPVEGAIVRAETEDAIPAKSADLRTAADGTVLLESFPAGDWTILARAPGRGRGKTRVRLPHQGEGPVEVALSSRTVEVEVVAAGTGRPVEGATIHVREEWFRGGKPMLMSDFGSPIRPPPTDSSGRTRLEGVATDEPLEVLPVPPGESFPPEGTVPVRVEPGATAVRLELAAKRRVRWPLVAGERPVPPDGTEVRIVEASTLRMMDLGLGDRFAARVAGGEITLEGSGGRSLSLVAVAPDGSLARLRAAAGAERGEPASFADPKALEVVVRDEDGAAVTDSIVMLKDEEGEPLATMEAPDATGTTRFEGLPAGAVVVCALAHWDYGGAEVARTRLTEARGKIEVVVGRPIPVRARVRIGGKPRLPEKFELLVRYPGPAPFEELCHEQVRDGAEDAERGEVRFSVRPHAPGKPVRLELRVPGRGEHGAEVRPVAAGGEAVVEFDLPAE